MGFAEGLVYAGVSAVGRWRLREWKWQSWTGRQVRQCFPSLLCPGAAIRLWDIVKNRENFFPASTISLRTVPFIPIHASILWRMRAMAEVTLIVLKGPISAISLTQGCMHTETVM